MSPEECGCLINMAIPLGSIAAAPFALRAAALGNSQAERRVLRDLGKRGLKAAEKPLRRSAGNALEDLAKKVAHSIRGDGLEIHKAIGKLSRPKGVFMLPGHKYMGPYNPLVEQLCTTRKKEKFSSIRSNPRTILTRSLPVTTCVMIWES